MNMDLLDKVNVQVRKNTLDFRRVLAEPENQLVLMLEDDELVNTLNNLIVVQGNISHFKDAKGNFIAEAGIHVYFQRNEKEMATLQKVSIDASYWLFCSENDDFNWRFNLGHPMYRLFNSIDWSQYRSKVE